MTKPLPSDSASPRIAPFAEPGDPLYDRLKSWLEVEIQEHGSYAQSCLWYLDGTRDVLHPAALEWVTEVSRGQGPRAQRALEFLEARTGREKGQ